MVASLVQKDFLSVKSHLTENAVDFLLKIQINDPSVLVLSCKQTEELMASGQIKGIKRQNIEKATSILGVVALDFYTLVVRACL